MKDINLYFPFNSKIVLTIYFILIFIGLYHPMFYIFLPIFKPLLYLLTCLPLIYKFLYWKERQTFLLTCILFCFLGESAGYYTTIVEFYKSSNSIFSAYRLFYLEYFYCFKLLMAYVMIQIILKRGPHGFKIV